MTKYPIVSSELIPKERNIVSDINKLIDTYANLEYNRVKQLIEGCIQAIGEYVLNPNIEYKMKSEQLNVLIRLWMDLFGWTYRQLVNTLQTHPNSYLLNELLYQIVISFINQSSDIDQGDIVDILKDYLTTFLNVWALEEEYSDISLLNPFLRL